MSRSKIAFAVALMFALPAWAADPAPVATAPVESNGQKIQGSMTTFRDELQALETEVVSKSVTFSADEASAFWPVFKRFQTEQRAIMDGQVEAVREYADKGELLTPEDSMGYVNALLRRDQQVHDLRVKYLAEYEKVVGKAKAARVIHISRKLGTVSQAKISDVIPLVQ
jgi:hypothetical protein